MKEIILEKYYEILEKNTTNEIVLGVIEHDYERADKALTQVYKMFSDLIESDMIESLLTLTVAYIVEMQL